MSQTIPDNQTALDGQQAGELAGGKRSALEQICVSIVDDLAATERLLLAEQTGASEFVSKMLAQTPLMGGKRMRPVLVFLAGGCVGGIQEKHHALAAAIELVHTATLVHDDILDGAETRRHVSTVNSIWDNTTSVLVGDYLFTQSFEVAARSGIIDAISKIAVASSRVCEGEMLQNAAIANFELTEAEYFEIIRLKTAELCKCACGLGVLASGGSEEEIQSFENFGNSIGVAFQIVDDVLDLVGHEGKVGKTLGTDLANKKLTLPLIHCLRESDDENRDTLLKQLKSETPNVSDVLSLLANTNSIEYARTKASEYATEAMTFAGSQDDSEHAIGLRRLAEFVLKRTH